MGYPLSVAFVWHMHQPFYKDNLTGEYTLPWVRLHATKDYLHMADILAEHPKVHQTYNFVPSLVEQLLDYAADRAEDRALRATRRAIAPPDSAGYLTREDKEYILGFFFSINWENFVRRYPRYWQLLRLRNELGGDVELLSAQYWRDLVAWFNLVWIDPTRLSRDPMLGALVEKGRNFSREDVLLIVEKHRQICEAVLPRYRELADRGQVELTTTPYYHPIMPLLVDTRVARVASPVLPLPNTLFANPEDAREQIRLAANLHKKVFGQRPKGMWPSEGSVSAAVIDLLSSPGLFPNGESLDWVATDEGILSKTLGYGFPRDQYGSLEDPRILYQPYSVRGRNLAIIFRDQVLSDRIGFVYKHWNPNDAANDLVGRLDAMADKVAHDDRAYLCSIILDGENCWEEYQNNGADFLHALYSKIEHDPKLRAVTVSEHLAEHHPRAELNRLHAGSWIMSNLETWIGEPPQNRAWEYLALTRSRLVTWQRETTVEDVRTLESAWNEIYTAEGSDWFWWYYSRNSQGKIMPFDTDFRHHLGNVYRIMGLPGPSWLDRPIVGPPPERSRDITGYVQPRLTADSASPEEWTAAGYLEPELSTGSMQMGQTLLHRLYYGYNPAELCLRLEADGDLGRRLVAFYLATDLSGQEDEARGNSRTRFDAYGQKAEAHGLSLNWEVQIGPHAQSATLSRALGNGLWETVRTLASVAMSEQAVELRLPLDALGLSLGDTVNLIAAVGQGRSLEDTLPTSGSVSFTLVG